LWRRLGGQCRPIGLAAHDSPERVGNTDAWKRAPAGEHFVQKAAERPDIGPRINAIAHCLFGTHIGDGANERAFFGTSKCLSEIRSAERRIDTLRQRRDAEVQHFDRSRVGELDVRRLQVAMDNALSMRRFERCRDCGRTPQRFAQEHRPSEQALLQRLAFDELEHQNRSVVEFENIEEGADVRMADLREQPPFALESRETIGVADESPPQHLERNVSPQPCIAGAIDLAHGAITEQTDNLIRSESLARPQPHRVCVPVDDSGEFTVALLEQL
jgi:hypothetical protein